MDCVACGSAAVSERPERTARGYRRSRCCECGKQYDERSGGLLNHAHYPSDVIALVVLRRLRYRLTLRDLAEMFLQRGIIFSHEAVREWEEVGGQRRDENRRTVRQAAAGFLADAMPMFDIINAGIKGLAHRCIADTVARYAQSVPVRFLHQRPDFLVRIGQPQ